MKTIERESHGAIIGGGNFKDGVIYWGDSEEYINFIEDIENEIYGNEIYTTDPIDIPHGDGERFRIYSEEDETGVTIWVKKEDKYNDEGEFLDTIYYFGVLE